MSVPMDLGSVTGGFASSINKGISSVYYSTVSGCVNSDTNRDQRLQSQGEEISKSGNN